MKFKALLWVLVFFSGNLIGQKRSVISSSRDTSVKLLSDDPIAAALDSLAYLKLFETGRSSVELSRIRLPGISQDSVPVFDAGILAARIAKLDAQSPFKMVYNDEVKAYINMYTIRKRNQVSRMLGLSELYFPLFEEKLAKYKMPLELKYLAIIESALNPEARSRAGAQGLWQFMYGTGKLFGLKINSYVDERCDPLKATEAACMYMKYLYSIYKDWALVLAAYNSGPGNVNKAIRRSGGKTDYWELRPFLPRETAGYVPAFIAATYVMNYSKEHNLYPVTPRAIFNEVDTLHITRKVTFAQLSNVLDMPVEDIAFLNPSFLLQVIPEAESYHVLTLPRAKIATYINNEEIIYNYKPGINTSISADTAGTPAVSRPSQAKFHTVKSGESISMVARKYGITVAEVKSWNRLQSSKLIRGQKLRVNSPYKAQVQEVITASGSAIKLSDTSAPTAETNPSTDNNTKQNSNPGEKEGFGLYKVKSGDTHWKISVNHGMTLDEFRKLNKFTIHTMLKPGMMVKVNTKK